VKQVQKKTSSTHFLGEKLEGKNGNSLQSTTYFLRKKSNQRKIFWLLRFQHRQLRLVTLGGSPLRTHANYRQRSGARHQLAPECGKSYSRPTISSTSATRRSQQRSGARQQLRLRLWLWFYDNNFASDRDCDSTTTTRLHLRLLRLRRNDHAAPDKS
jgi:hypothetical protein